MKTIKTTKRSSFMNAIFFGRFTNYFWKGKVPYAIYIYMGKHKKHRQFWKRVDLGPSRGDL